MDHAPADAINPPQHQDQQPGLETQMHPKPDFMPKFPGNGRLEGKVAIITGGDSGIGRACAVLFAREGAEVALIYLNETEDAKITAAAVRAEGKDPLLVRGDIGEQAFCDNVVGKVVEEFGRLDVLVNNAAEQHPQDEITDISAHQLQRTFQTNIYGYFYMTQAAVPFLRAGATIVNTTSVTAYRGSATLLDYSATKGAIVAFTRALSANLVDKGIRVNAVAPGPIWTPLIPSTMPQEDVTSFGENTPLGRAGQPAELACAYVMLASPESSYITGAVIPVTGGRPML